MPDAPDPRKEQEAANITPDKKYTLGGNVYTVDQETTNQLVLDEAAAMQTRLNMQFAAREDENLKAYFTEQEKGMATLQSNLKRAEYGTIGQQDRLKVGVEGFERRKLAEVEGAETRETAGIVGKETRLTEGVKGAEERLTQREGLLEGGRQARQTQAERYVGERGLEAARGEQARA